MDLINKLLSVLVILLALFNQIPYEGAAVILVLGWLFMEQSGVANAAPVY
jgi:hypothetical protein